MKAALRGLLLAPFFLQAFAAVAETVSLTAVSPKGVTDRIPATLSRPDGPGPFSAVVVLHDCSGLGPRASGAATRWAGELLSRGYVVLLPDSFSTRGFPAGVCTDPSPRRNDVNVLRRPGDAYAALGYLRTLDYVDGRRIGLMGNSHGGAAVLTTTTTEAAAANAPGFVAALAFYPDCSFAIGTWLGRGGGVYRAAAPLHILIGERDDWTPAEPCRRLAAASQAAGYPVSIKVYPGAHHAFDNNAPVRYVAARMNPRAPGGRGATTGGDPAAWADSLREVDAFFDRHLRRQP